MTSKRRLAVLSLCAVQLAFFSCGGGDDDPPSASAKPGDGATSGNVTTTGPSANSSDRGDIVTEWHPAGSELQQGVADALQSNRVFEELAGALNQALKLPRDLPVVHELCGEENAYYDPKLGKIRMCYELLEQISLLAAQGTSDEEEIGNRVISTWLFVFFHELGHGLIDLYDLPVTGKEEDAVDDFSTVLLTEAGAAEFAIRAAEYWALTSEEMYDGLAYADEHSLNPQRFFSILCTVYGSDPEQYAAIVSEGYLPAARAARCPAEYAQKRSSWDKLLQPWAK